MTRQATDDGLQPERTALSWSRTSVGVLGNGALLLARVLDHDTGPVRLLPAGLAVVITIATYVVSRQLHATLARRPLPVRLAPRLQIRLIGGSVLVLIVVTALT